MRRLTRYVHVADDTGAVHGFGPGDHVPAWAAAKITNPHVWEGTDHTPIVTIATGGGGGGGGGQGIVIREVPDPGHSVEEATADDDAAGDPAVASGNGDGPPAQRGTGSNRQAWADYAESRGVTVEPDWKREDIIAACEAAGVPV
ncbi:hypothetical protein [Nocardia cyriacigeorgica]|uniref:hypothetical protein n=1 Tax=Nocardia cyriacigeorgica TaxID=135487 RepID=UPI002458E07E|nr:hypothetical protein [Nocardia cyriacigeorgica]